MRKKLFKFIFCSITVSLSTLFAYFVNVRFNLLPRLLSDKINSNYRGHGFKFSITKDLDDSKSLDEQFWTNIEILEDCEEGPSKNVSFKVDTSSVLASEDYSFTIFFANDKHNVLEVHLVKSTTEGIYYTTPYKLERRIKGPETSRIENGDRTEISGMFPKSWLPSDCNLVSGSLTLGDGRYYNYYTLKNFKLSIPDLKVLEEYKKYESCSR